MNEYPANGAMYLGVRYDDMIDAYGSQTSLLFDMVEVADNLIYFFIPIVVIILAKDFSRRTAVNYLISGGSREQFYFKKLTLSVLVMTGLLLFYYLLTFLCLRIFSVPMFSGTSGFPVFIGAVALQYLSLIAYTCFAVMLAAVSKNIVATVIGCILICYVPAGISGMIHTFFPGAYSILQRLDIIKNIRMARYIQNLTANDITSIVVIALIYILAFSFIGFLTMKRSDIK